MKILYKLLIGFFIVVFVSLISGVISAKLINSMNSDITSVEQDKYPINKYSTNYQRGATQLWVGTYIYANGDSAMGNQYIKNGKKLMTESRTELSKYEDTKLFLEKENSAIASSDAVITAVKEHKAQIDAKANESHIAEHEQRIKFNLNILQQRTESLNLLLSTQVDKTQEEMTVALSDARIESENISKTNYASIIISLIVSLITAIVVSLMITKPLKKLTDAADKLTSGDMTVVVPEIKTKDEIQLLGSLIAMQTEIIKMNGKKAETQAKEETEEEKTDKKKK